MKKKLWIILGVIVLLLIVIFYVAKLNSKKEEKVEDKIPVYNADVICTLSGVESIEDEEEEYSLKAYLTIKDNMVMKAILVGVSSDAGNLAVTQNLMDDYNRINGINAKSYLSNERLITEVEYNYEVIDLDEVKSELGYLLIDDSIFLQAKSLPVSLREYQKYELQDYECN